MKIGLGATVKLFQMYLKGGPTPPLDPLHMHISPWYQFRPIRFSSFHPFCAILPQLDFVQKLEEAFSMSEGGHEMIKLPRGIYRRMLDTLAYAA